MKQGRGVIAMSATMDVRISDREPLGVRADALAVFVAEHKPPALHGALLSLDRKLGGSLRALFEAAGFHGEAERVFVHHSASEGLPKKLIFVGLGAKGQFSEEVLRRAACHAVRGAGDESRVVLVAPEAHDDAAREVEALVVGASLARYRFDRFQEKGRARKGKPSGSVTLIVDRAVRRAAVEGGRVGAAVVEGMVLARDLGNLPGNHGTPTALASAARRLARGGALRARILDSGAMRKLGMGSLLSVAQGADEPPKLIVLEYGRAQRGRKTVCIVGKGVTFDSGGISIKPAAEMDKMRYDKCGGCATIGALAAIARLKPNVHVVGLVPATENMTGGSATRPGDLVTAMNGKTIEVLNTDAEGRLILADAIAYSLRYKPDHIVDLATLTGACVMTFGSHTSAILGSDEALITALREAGDATGERLWPLPLHDEYDQMIRGTYGDLKNIGGPKGGTITAAAFIRHFTGGKSWAHLDIAGTAYDDSARVYNNGSGATGVGVRLLVRWLTGAIATKRPRA